MSLGAQAGARVAARALPVASPSASNAARLTIGERTQHMRADEDKRIDRKSAQGIDRRTFVTKGLLAGGALLGGGLAVSELADATDSSGPPPSPMPAPALSQPALRETAASATAQTRPEHPRDRGRPAALSAVVRRRSGGPGLPPNLRRLRQGAVSFAHHYTASNDCTPARATLLTGLYTHQTGCMITGGSTLDPGFPTWGSMLREHGYHTYWYGKWHLTHGDNKWTARDGERELERYGFAGGTYPSPDGAPGQGWRVDPGIAGQFEQWLPTVGEAEPWCTTVSFVNPHDIAWWYGWSDRVPAEAYAPSVIGQLPPNFETPEHAERTGQAAPAALVSGNRGRLVRAGPVHGPGSRQHMAAVPRPLRQAPARGRLAISAACCDALESRPRVAANTVIVFTSDHGEYGASHGLRGKGASAYEEAIRVPLIVKDPRGTLTNAPEPPRTQLTSSVDVAPLLLSIASGSDEWRTERRYAHLARRADLARILADPAAPGRPYVLHATDETVTEFAIEPYAAYAPLHVVALRTPRPRSTRPTPTGRTDGIEPLAAGQERELYDYSTSSGRLELDNGAGAQPAGGLAARAAPARLRRRVARATARSAARRARARRSTTTSRSPPARPNARRCAGPNASSRTAQALSVARQPDRRAGGVQAPRTATIARAWI